MRTAGGGGINLHKLNELRHSTAEYCNERKKCTRPAVSAVRSLAISTGRGRDGDTKTKSCLWCEASDLRAKSQGEPLVFTEICSRLHAVRK